MAETVTLNADTVVVQAAAPQPADGTSVTLVGPPVSVLMPNSVFLTAVDDITVINTGTQVVLTGNVVTVTPGALSAAAGANITAESGQTFTLTGTDTGAASRRWTFGGNTISTEATVTLTAEPVLRTTQLTYTYTVTSVGGETASSSVLVTVLGASRRIKVGGVMRPSIRRTRTGAAPGPITQTAMPTANLPGWTFDVGQDFNTAAPIGGAIRTAYPAMRFYEGFKDTSQQGDYAVDDVVSAHDGLLDVFLHTNAAGSRRIACVMPFGYSSFTAGRVEVEFWAETIPGYKIAFMLWPNSDNWGEGEIDFAETDLGATNTINQFHHQLGANPGANAYSAGSSASIHERHRAAVEWTPAGVKYFIDGVQKINATTHIPTTPHSLRLQFETNLSGQPVPATSAGHVYVSWAARWTYTP